MKKIPQILRLALILCSSFMALAACRSKDEDKNVKQEPKVYPVTNGLHKFYSTAGLLSEQALNSTLTYEEGYIFSPKVKGRITGISARLPKANPNLRVTIWDHEKKAVLRTEILDVPSPGLNSQKNIAEILLDQDRKYMITMNTNNYYRRETAGRKPISFPVSVDQINYFNYHYTNTTQQTVPVTQVSPGTYNGDLSFDFQQLD